MSERYYTDTQVMDAIRAGTAEVLGNDTMTTNVVIGSVAMKLLQGPQPESDVAPEVDYTKAPNYSNRAICAQSPRDVADLIIEGADRLSKSIASYERPLARLEDEPEPAHHSLTPTIFAEGTTVAEQAIGRLDIYWENPKGYDYSGQNTVASLHLQGGETAPSDPLGRNETEFMQTLSVVKTEIHNPLTNSSQEAYYLEAEGRYRGRLATHSNGIMHEAKYGKPIGYEGAIIKANVFWALDMAITYYENIYIAGNKHPGLSYADYRDAGCLDENLLLDWQKAEAYVLSRKNETEARSGGWPRLKDHKTNVLTMDQDHRERVEKFKDSLRAGMQSVGKFVPVAM